MPLKLFLASHHHISSSYYYANDEALDDDYEDIAELENVSKNYQV